MIAALEILGLVCLGLGVIVAALALQLTAEEAGRRLVSRRVTAARVAAFVALALVCIGLFTATARFLGLELAAGKCDRALSAHRVLHAGEVVDLYGEGVAPITVDRPVVVCIDHSTGRPM